MKKLTFLVLMGFVVFTSLKAQSKKDLYIKGNGLLGEYYNGYDENKVLVFSRVDPQIDFYWYRNPIAPKLNKTDVFIRWTGKLFSPKSGKCRLIFRADDGVRLWLNDILLIDKWQGRNVTTYSVEVKLKRGRSYDLKIEFLQMSHDATAKLMWNFENEPSQLISPKYLYTQDRKVEVLEEEPADEKSFFEGFWGYVDKAKASFEEWFIEEVEPPSAEEQQALIKKKVSQKDPEPEKQNKRVEEQPVAKLPQPKPENRVDGLPKPVKKEETSVVQPVKKVEEAFVYDRAFKAANRGEVVTINNLLFEQGRFFLHKSSYTELDRLAASLQQFSSINIMVIGHTDNVGDPVLNERLSINRAKVVANYIIGKGVDESRIEVAGYGGGKPIVDNDTEENRSKNRRVEVVIK
jgi:outer membrane protein OmpA-like peptidoglycan-associated protein